LNRLRRFAAFAALPSLSGVLYFLSWIGFGIWPLAFVCFLPLLWALRDASPKQALKLGAWMGFVTHLGGYTWIMHLLQDFAFAPLPLALAGYVLLCAAQGFLFGVTAFVLRWAWLKTRWPLWALLPLALCAVEWLYPLLFQSYTGVALLPVLPLVQIADLGGVLLLSALQALVNGALADVLLAVTGTSTSAPLKRLAAGPIFALVLSLAGSSSYGVYALLRQQSLEKAATKRITGIAQPDVGEVDLHTSPQASVRALWEQTAELHTRGAELVVWPEVGFNLQPINVALKDHGRFISGNIPVSLVAGIARVEPPRRMFNSAVMISPQGLLGDHYDKIALLAFGEYIPFGDVFPVLYQWSPMAAPLNRGTTTAPLHDGPWRLAATICYEGILPGVVFATMKDHGDGRAHVMVNLTNDSWYGAGHEQEQHLMLAAVRTIEHRRWLVRATSTGISAFVDSMGRVVQRLERNQRAIGLQPVPMLEGTTLYERLGDWPGYSSALILILIAGREWLRARRAPRGPAPARAAR
jgi:apolipoprotein N-acyltransferase